MTTIIAISNQKGGVAKTTTCQSLGACLAEQGQSVLLIDLDPQAHLTMSMGLEPEKVHRSIVDALLGISHQVRTIRAIGSASLALAWVALGRLDAYFNLQLMPWDVAAASLLIRQAGGDLTDVAGQPLSLNSQPMTCLASNGRLHARLLTYMPTQNPHGHAL